jgi:hypothetical protein
MRFEEVMSWRLERKPATHHVEFEEVMSWRLERKTCGWRF